MAGVTTQDNIGEGQPTSVETSVKTGARNLRVFVLDSRGQPLMPTYPRKARKLLSACKAHVVRRVPFTIQLDYVAGGNTQQITLGVDAGSGYIGVSATTSTDVLFEAEVELRTDIVALLATRRANRNSRRRRKTRYRQARFLNRRKMKGWLAPSIHNKIWMHAKTVNFVRALLPVTTTIVEVAQFDIQKIRHPTITKAEYRAGPQSDFWNVREYCLARDGHKCQHCLGKTKDKILNVHHIETRQTGGDSPDNLITLCKTCHTTIHKDKLTKTIKRRSVSFRDAAYMNTMRRFVVAALTTIDPSTTITYGYVTKCTRINCALPKTHTMDARCISGNPLAKPTQVYLMHQTRGQNRRLHKSTILKGGLRKANKAARYVFGFQIFDRVMYRGVECFVFARRSDGYFDIRYLDGTRINAGVSYKKLRLLGRAKTLLVARQND